MSDYNIQNSSLYNEDLAPVGPERRTWNMWHIAALWVSMSVCITTYMLAAGLIAQGMAWWQALFTIALANCIVLIPMILNAHAGTKYGIPFPVLLRASFGTLGANVPALMRGFVACGWFGIQTWIGGSAIYTLHAVIFGFTPVDIANPAHQQFLLPIIGLSWGQLACFLLFWVVNLVIVIAGIETIKWLESLAAPLLIVIGLGMLAWGVSEAGGFGVIFSADTLDKVRQAAGWEGGTFNFWAVFWPSLTAMVGYWATLSLNIPDFTRFAKSQRDQALGQAIGLPTTMALYSFIGIAVTCASVVIFGEAIWDPVALIGRFDNALVVGLSLFFISVATLSTNIAANVVSPANDISNLKPSKISFRMGGIITCFIGVIIMPWKLMSDLGNYIFTWLIGYSSLLGAIAGVMIADYYLLRRCRLNMNQIYVKNGEYGYDGRYYNWRAMLALALGIIPMIPGFLQAATHGEYFQAPAFFNAIYTYAWFVSLFIAGLAYLVFNALEPVNVKLVDNPMAPAKPLSPEEPLA